MEIIHVLPLPKRMRKRMGLDGSSSGLVGPFRMMGDPSQSPGERDYDDFGGGFDDGGGYDFGDFGGDYGIDDGGGFDEMGPYPYDPYHGDYDGLEPGYGFDLSPVVWYDIGSWDSEFILMIVVYSFIFFAVIYSFMYPFNPWRTHFPMHFSHHHSSPSHSHHIGRRSVQNQIHVLPLPQEMEERMGLGLGGSFLPGLTGPFRMGGPPLPPPPPGVMMDPGFGGLFWDAEYIFEIAVYLVLFLVVVAVIFALLSSPTGWLALTHMRPFHPIRPPFHHHHHGKRSVQNELDDPETLHLLTKILTLDEDELFKKS